VKDLLGVNPPWVVDADSDGLSSRSDFVVLLLLEILFLFVIRVTCAVFVAVTTSTVVVLPFTFFDDVLGLDDDVDVPSTFASPSPSFSEPDDFANNNEGECKPR